jgi:hypothetical protein
MEHRKTRGKTKSIKEITIGGMLVESNQIKNLINKFLSLILDTFNAEQRYLDLKVHYDEKCDYINAIANQINEQEIEKKKSLEEQEKYEERLKETKLSVVDAHIYKEKIHNYRLTRWICDEEISRLRQERDEFVKICNKLKLETDLAHQKYNELFNSLYSFCTNLSEIELEQIVEYFDYDDIAKKTQKDITDSIINFIIDDIKTIYDYDLDFEYFLFSYQNYQGPITLLNIILEQKEIVEQYIKIYIDTEKRLTEIDSIIEENMDSKLKMDEELDILESSIYSRIFKRKLIDNIEKEKYDNYRKINRLILESCALSKKQKIIRKTKRDYYQEYKKINSLVPKLINKLGEKNLRKLIKKLNMTINKTEDNYFNEKEEMKLALKKWFYSEEMKLDELFNTEDKVEMDSRAELKILKK